MFDICMKVNMILILHSWMNNLSRWKFRLDWEANPDLWDDWTQCSIHWAKPTGEQAIVRPFFNPFRLNCQDHVHFHIFNCGSKLIWFISYISILWYFCWNNQHFEQLQIFELQRPGTLFTSCPVLTFHLQCHMEVCSNMYLTLINWPLHELQGGWRQALVACEQALHLGELWEVTWEQHPKGDAR